MSEENIYIPPRTNDVESFAKWLGRRWVQAYQDMIQSWGQAYSNYASSVGHPCERHLYYQRIDAERKPITPRLQMVFQRGNVMEDETISFMRSSMDIEWAKSQQSAPKDDLNIGMKIDGGIRGRGNREDAYLIAEVKTANAHEFAKITRDDVQGIHDLLNKCGWWLRKYVYQAVCYLRYFQEPGVIIIVREPASWDAKFLPMANGSPIYLKLWDEIESKVKRINAAVEAGDAPERIVYDKSVCEMCDYSTTVCLPEKANEGAEILAHPDVVSATEELLGLEDQAKRVKDVKAFLRDLVLQTGRDHVILGDLAEAKVSKAGAVRITPLKGDLFFGGDDD